MSSIEVINIKIPIIHMKNSQHETALPRKETLELGVVFEDKVALAELGDRYDGVIRLPASILDVN